MKSERVSYDVITPSAARAIFDAILWKPAIFWQVTAIEVLTPVKWISIRRNEVSNVASDRSDCIFIEDSRTQRAGLFLRDVKYRLHANFEFVPPEQRMKQADSGKGKLQFYNPETEDSKSDETEAKYAAMFERRAKKGQYFHQPYLGCREFPAYFKLIDPETNPAAPIDETRDLGFMLYDIDFSDEKKPKPMFYRPRLVNGRIDVPARDSAEVLR
jgi:CRISPR-associated protein Cas5d